MSILEDLMAVMGLNDENSSLGGIGGSAILMVENLRRIIICLQRAVLFYMGSSTSGRPFVGQVM